MKRTIVAIFQSLAIAIYHLFSLLPTRNRIVCLSRQSDDTPLDFVLLHEEVRRTHPDVQVVLLPKALNSIVNYLPHMLTQLFYIATSKAVVLDSYCIVVGLLGNSIKAPVLQMWHALGNMKKFGYMTLDTPEGRTSEDAKLWHMHEGYDSVLVSSKSFADDLAAGFHVPVSILYEAPLPRTDLLVSPQHRAAKRAEALEALPQLNNGKKNIVYCPTFRREAAPNEQHAMGNLLNAINFEKYNLIFKKHPVSMQHMIDDRVVQDIPAGVDPLYIADYAISDYSTVIYEAGLLNVPVFLYAYDWNDYSGKRSLNIDLEHDVPTLFTADAQAIAQAIETDSFDAAAFKRFIANNVAVPENGTCTQRVVAHIFDLIEGAKN